MTDSNRHFSAALAATIVLILLAALAAALSGCAVGPEYRKPDTPVAAHFSAAQPTAGEQPVAGPSSAAATAAPPRARRRTTASPIPWEPPVTRALFPLNSPGRTAISEAVMIHLSYFDTDPH